LEIPKNALALLLFFLKMFPDYQALVVLAYQTKLKAGELSTNILLPKPAKLKEECLLVCQERYLKKDEKLFRSFFEPREDKAGYMSAINGADIDKFRPLCNFLKDGNIKTSERNIELLAWLIDFEPRPYQIDRVYPAASAQVVEVPVVEEPIEVEEPIAVEPIIVNPPGTNRKLWYAFAAITLMILVGGGIYIINENQPDGCMVWSANHYKAVPCTQKNDSLSTIAVDTFRLAHFKRIDKPDTITGRALGSIWYIKLNGGIEYYTAGGAHPVYPERRLRPLTLYMLNKYIRHL
jgi:hypothetical protein